jgi:PIN domain nuclease of toxin-antitoxin system
LSAATRRALRDPENAVRVSAASAWEMAIKAAAGKLRTPDGLEEALAQMDFLPLPITAEHGIAAGALPRLHGDPFDRMLVAQARCEGLTLVTGDAKIRDYGVPILDP